MRRVRLLRIDLEHPNTEHMKVKYASPRIKDLKPGHAGNMEFSDRTTANYGVIRLERDALVHYSGQGLRFIHKPDMNEEEQAEARKLKALLKEPDGEQQLIALGHIAMTPWRHIARILS
jgi:hypothetical protein